MKPFKILDSKKLVNEPFCHIDKELVEIPNGETRDWYVYQNRDAVIVIPVLEGGQILLQKNYKHGSRHVVTEFPAGLIDEGESWEETAPRELLEETGYSPKKCTKLGQVFANPTSSPMQYHIILAEGCIKAQEPENEPEEQIEPFLVSDLDAVREILLAPETKTSAGAVAALQFVRG